MFAIAKKVGPAVLTLLGLGGAVVSAYSGPAPQYVYSAAGPLLAGQEDGDEHHRYAFVLRDRVFLGVQLVGLTSELRTHFGVPEDVGVMVSKVVEGSPAEAAGIETGDILTAVDGETIDSSRELIRAIRKREVGDTVEIELFRDGGAQTASVTLAEGEGGSSSFRNFNFTFGGLPEGFGEHLRESLEHAMESDEWREALDSIEHLDFRDLEEKLEELGERLEELEERLGSAESRGKRF